MTNNNQNKVVDKFGGSFYTCSVRKDGILIVDVFKNDILSPEDIQQIVLHIHRNYPNRLFPHLINPSPETITTYDGLLYLSGPERTLVTCADAFLLTSFQQRILFNFYNKFQKPKWPTKAFGKKEECIEWLYQVSKEYIIK